MIQKIKRYKRVCYCIIVIFMITALTYVYLYNPLDKVNDSSRLMQNSEYLVTGPVYHEYLSNGKATYGLGLYLPTNGLPEKLGLGRYLTDGKQQIEDGYCLDKRVIVVADNSQDEMNYVP